MPKRQTKRRTAPRTPRFKKARFLEGVKVIDTNDSEFLRKFVTEHGSIMPARVTGATAKQQRQIRNAIKRLRTMGLLP